MKIAIDNDDFCIRVYSNVAYLKVMGMQDEEAAYFFSSAIDQMLEEYSCKDLASVCDLRDLIISSPEIAGIINNAIRKLTYQLKYKYNAVIVSPKFGQIVRAYVFSFYLRDTNLKTHVFSREDKAIKWIESKGFCVEEIKMFLMKYQE
ncbi:hypothetical protein [Labilibaculum euxinus]